MEMALEIANICVVPIVIQKVMFMKDNKINGFVMIVEKKNDNK